MARAKVTTEAESVVEERFPGIATEGASGYPHNHRLRAEAFVADGIETDPDGLISDELIADTRARLEAEAAAPIASETETVDDTGGEETETETADEPNDQAVDGVTA